MGEDPITGIGAIDTHCHCGLVWYEPVETLIHQMDAAGVAKAVVVQQVGQFDNSYQRACVARFPDRLASVVTIDTDAPDASTRLRREIDEGAAGLRLHAASRSPGDDPFHIWRVAEKFSIPVSCPGTSDDLASDEFNAMLTEVPNLKVVIEHLGSSHAYGNPPEEATDRQRVSRLAQFPNVYVKFGGLGEYATRKRVFDNEDPFERPTPSDLTLAFEAFGAYRLLWGSDFPLVCGREGYANSLVLCQRELAAFPTQLDQVFRATAENLFFAT